MKKTLFFFLALLGLFFIVTSAEAGSNVQVGVYFGVPAYYAPPPVVVYPSVVLAVPVMVVPQAQVYGYVNGGCGSHYDAYYGPPGHWKHQKNYGHGKHHN